MAHLKHDGASRFTFCVPRVEVEERGDCQRIAADRTRTDDESPLCRASYVHVPCAQQRFPDSSVPQRQSLEHVMYSLDISRVYYAVSSQVSALILLSLLSTTAVDNADEEGQLMKSLKADIANAHEHPRTVLTESFGIVCFNHGRLHRCCKEGRCGCYGRSWYAATVSANASTFTLPTSEYTHAGSMGFRDPTTLGADLEV